jgi:hypothetical protein
MTVLDDARPTRSPAADAADVVAHAVHTGSLPSLVAFYGQDLTLLACTEAYPTSGDAGPENACGRHASEVLSEIEAEQLLPHLLRSVLGATVHLALRGVDDRRSSPLRTAHPRPVRRRPRAARRRRAERRLLRVLTPRAH